MPLPLRSLALTAGLALAPIATAAAAPPDVVTSIRPVHSLAAFVMDGVAEPHLLLPPGASPHDYALKPSDAQALSDADVVFWIGDPLETFLGKPLDSLATDARIVALASAPGLTLLRTRSGGGWAEHAHDHGQDDHAHEHEDDHAHEEEHAHEDEHAHDDEHAHEDDDHTHADEMTIAPLPELSADAAALPPDVDGHLWLDPRNAVAMGATMAEVLAEADPDNAATYRANAEDLAENAATMEASLREHLAPVADVPYVVFHDAYHYLEHRFGLNAVGSVTVEPGRPVGARRVTELRETVRDLNAACVFAEPQFEPRLVATVTEGTGAGTGVLDPLGGSIPTGPQLYPVMMWQMARALSDCLSSSANR